MVRTWQGRETNGRGGCCHAKNHTLNVTGRPLARCKSLLSRIPTRNEVRQRSIHRKICPRDQSLRQAEPTTAGHTMSLTDSDPQVSARSGTPIRISFDALTEDPSRLKGCVLLHRRAFMVRIMASTDDPRGGRVWSREEEDPDRESEAFG